MDGVYDGIKYWVLFGNEKYDSIYHRTRYLISVNTLNINNNFWSFKFTSNSDLNAKSGKL